MIYSQGLDLLKKSGNYRSIPTHEPTGSSVLDFSLNDYLGIGSNKKIHDDFFAKECNLELAMSSTASRLLAADQRQYELLEQDLSRLYSSRPSLVFNSGYHANIGLVSALASEGKVLIVADKLVHASIIDGIILSKAPFKRFRHNDFNHLEKILSAEHDKYDVVLTIVESVYSMDGDRADLDALVSIKQRYPRIMLYVDEAHAFGVLGEKGLGVCSTKKYLGDVDVIVGTLGKACASVGAFASFGNEELKEYAVNKARSFIFSTSLPPIQCAWTRHVINRIISMDAERAHLADLSEHLCRRLGQSEARYIIPVIIGSAQGAIAASRHLLENGVKVLPIRTPTVPVGTERLRISLSAAMNIDDVDILCDRLAEIYEL